MLPDYDMNDVRRRYGELKARLATAKEDMADVGEPQGARFYSRGKATAYQFAVEQFLEIFGPCLEE